MSREILFRIWNKKTKQYVDLKDKELRFLNDGSWEVVSEEHEYEQIDLWACSETKDILEQFTGLTDKNGNKIFEGDVVKITYDDDCIVEGTVVFSASAFQVDNESDDWELDMFQSIEVIGNIHEEGN